MFYVSLIVTTKQKVIIDSQKNKEKGIKAYHYGKSSVDKAGHQERKKGTKGLQNDQRTVNNTALVNPYLSIVTQKVNKFKSLIRRHRIATWIKKNTRPNYMLPTRD